MTTRRLRWLPRALWAVTLVLFGVAVALTLGDETTAAGDIPVIVILAFGMLSFATTGAVLASRVPSNPIGWLLLAVGLGLVTVISTNEYAVRALTDLDGLPGPGYAAWIGAASLPLAIVALPSALLVFPDGHLPSRRWRPAAWLLGAGVALVTLWSAFDPGTIDVSMGVEVRNPFGMGTESFWRPFAPAGSVAMIVGTALALASVVVRFRRSRRDERQQLRWLATAAAFVLIAMVAVLATGLTAGPDGQSRANDIAFTVMAIAFAVALPAAIAVALLKYRLYDLDLVVKKAVVATVLVVLLTGVFVLLAVVVGAVLSVAGLDSGGLAIAEAFAIGALLVPMWQVARRITDRLVYGGRAKPYEVLTEFSGRLAETYSTDDVLPRMAAIVADGTRAERVTIWLHVAGEHRPEATWPDGAAPEADPGPDAFEVRHQGELLGAITATMPANDPLNSSKERLIRDLASQAGLVLRNVRLIEELRASRRRIVAAVDEGRRRLERNIHDGAQQQLVALAVKLRLADTVVDRDPAKAHELLAHLQAETGDALENLRDLARGIYPPLLADEGLGAALEAQARKSPVPVHVVPNGIGRYPQDVEAGVYFCVLEALQNVAKYANASRVDVALRQVEGRLEFEVRDDGIGFDPATAARGSGLEGMADRIEAVGGVFTLESASGRGTRLRGVVPLGARASA